MLNAPQNDDYLHLNCPCRLRPLPSAILVARWGISPDSPLSPDGLLLLLDLVRPGGRLTRRCLCVGPCSSLFHSTLAQCMSPCSAPQLPLILFVHLVMSNTLPVSRRRRLSAIWHVLGDHAAAAQALPNGRRSPTRPGLGPTSAPGEGQHAESRLALLLLARPPAEAVKQSALVLSRQRLLLQRQQNHRHHLCNWRLV